MSISHTYHGNHWSRVHVFHQASKEWTVLQVNIVFLEKVFRSLYEFHSNKVESLLLKTLYDLAYKASLDPIWLDGNEGALTVGHGPEDTQGE